MMLVRRLCWMPRSSTATAASLFLMASVVMAQRSRDDSRDTVELKNGRIVRGLVVARYEDDELTMLVKGSKKTFPLARIRSVSTLNDALDGWLAKRIPGLSVAADWELALAATEAQLPAMARLQAYHVLLRDPNHAEAHATLGHRKRGKRWLWRLDQGEGAFVSRERFEKHHSDTGHPLVLDTEHYTVRSTSGLRRSIDLAFDLERLYVTWMKEFGARTKAREALAPMFVQVYQEGQSFPRLSSDSRPYYEPGRYFEDGAPNTVFTYHTRDDDGELSPRPVAVFDNAVQQLIFSTLITEKGFGGGNVVQRLGAWVEIGFGHWLGSRFRGNAGYATLQPFQMTPELAMAAAPNARDGVLRLASNELTNLVGLRYAQFFQIDAEEVPVLWAKSYAFVAYLMDPDTVIRGRRNRVLGSGEDAVLRYLVLAWHDGGGHSSSRVDEALSVKVETLRDPWAAWLSAFLR